MITLSLAIILGITSLPSVSGSLSWREFRLVQSRMGWLCLFIAWWHVVLSGWGVSKMFAFKCGVGSEPFVGAVLPTITLATKIPLLIFDRCLTRIRRGQDRKTICGWGNTWKMAGKFKTDQPNQRMIAGLLGNSLLLKVALPSNNPLTLGRCRGQWDCYLCRSSQRGLSATCTQTVLLSWCMHASAIKLFAISVILSMYWKIFNFRKRCGEKCRLQDAIIINALCEFYNQLTFTVLRNGLEKNWINDAVKCNHGKSHVLRFPTSLVSFSEISGIYIRQWKNTFVFFEPTFTLI